MPLNKSAHDEQKHKAGQCCQDLPFNPPCLTKEDLDRAAEAIAKRQYQGVPDKCGEKIEGRKTDRTNIAKSAGECTGDPKPVNEPEWENENRWMALDKV